MIETTLQTVKTTCPYCGVGCGVEASLTSEGQVSIKGDKDHPANFGRLCSKGTNLAETLALQGRLLFPQIHGRQTNWDEALDLIANEFKTAIEDHGPDSVAIYGSGQLLTEDYYVANKLMKGFIGSANIDTNSRLCMASTVAGHKRAFGSDTVPGNYEDLEKCDLLVLVGSNLAWCHPVLFQRIKAAKKVRPDMKVVLIDPRKTATAEIADMHLAIKSDGDTALFNGLLTYLSAVGFVDKAYIKAHTDGFDKALKASGPLDFSEIFSNTGLLEHEVRAFYDLFISKPKTVTVFSQGVNQSVGGTDKVNAILNCHLATGRIGKPGTGPFSVTGQPNAMGGREVGGLANQLAAHMDVDNPDHQKLVQDFWKSPVIADKPGLKAVDLFQAAAEGKIKVLWILATNPVDSLPDANLVQKALRNCDLVIASDILKETDTVRHAHVKLPSLGWGEKKGTVTNSERRISLQTPFLSAPGDAKADWWQLSEVGCRMGFVDEFSYYTAADIFREHAALSGFENEGSRDFDISGLSNLSDDEYDAFAPVQWPVAATGNKERFFSDGRFYTKSGKANFVPVTAGRAEKRSGEYPILLNTGRVRDHWHTMTRTAKSPRLSHHISEPFVDIHPLDAKALQLKDTELAQIENDLGSITVRVVVSDQVKPGTAFIPMHWTDQYASNGRVDVLVASDTDPVSGQPGFKHNFVSVKKMPVSSYGYAIGRNDPVTTGADYWAKARCKNGWQTELAYENPDRNWVKTGLQLWGAKDQEENEILYYEDEKLGEMRVAAFRGNELLGALFISRSPLDISRSWLIENLQAVFEKSRDKSLLLAGRPGKGVADKGPIVCACFDVGASQISRAITKGCRTVEMVGRELSAGTNCGSCRTEIQGILDRQNDDLVAAE